MSVAGSTAGRDWQAASAVSRLAAAIVFSSARYTRPPRLGRRQLAIRTLRVVRRIELAPGSACGVRRPGNADAFVDEQYLESVRLKGRQIRVARPVVEV